jgi:hypothetical protein
MGRGGGARGRRVEVGGGGGGEGRRGQVTLRGSIHFKGVCLMCVVWLAV